MKSIAAQAFLATLLAVAPPSSALGQQPAAPPPTTGPTSPTGDPAAAPPVVRLPSFPLNPATPATAEPTANTSTNAVAAGQAEFGLQGGGATVSASDASALRTNRWTEGRGALPKVFKPERRGVGGFLAGFANLFNPLAPVDQGTGGATEYWYDGQLNTAPLPRVFQDERWHEPQIGLMKIPLESDGTKGSKPKSRP
ncbi:MAG: hypothetical protein JNK85_13710 [Verrucomicrobiales bacterium]|nr:hypothetical protein [Verrucomicrobiales bacterium]